MPPPIVVGVFVHNHFTASNDILALRVLRETRPFNVGNCLLHPHIVVVDVFRVVHEVVARHHQEFPIDFPNKALRAVTFQFVCVGVGGKAEVATKLDNNPRRTRLHRLSGHLHVVTFTGYTYAIHHLRHCGEWDRWCLVCGPNAVLRWWQNARWRSTLQNALQLCCCRLEARIRMIFLRSFVLHLLVVLCQVSVSFIDFTLCGKEFAVRLSRPCHLRAVLLTESFAACEVLEIALTLPVAPRLRRGGLSDRVRFARELAPVRGRCVVDALAPKRLLLHPLLAPSRHTRRPPHARPPPVHLRRRSVARVLAPSPGHRYLLSQLLTSSFKLQLNAKEKSFQFSQFL